MAIVTRTRVVKLGGSLLAAPQLRGWIELWLREDPPDENMRSVWLVGGGPRVDAIRRQQHETQMSDSEAHFASIRTMSLTANELHEQRPGWPILWEVSAIAAAPGLHLIFDPADWLSSDVELPHAWSVTSDSIARHLAATIGAQELVLLKSRPARSDSLLENVRDGLLDEHFLQLAMPPGSRCRVVCLRSRHLISTTLSRSHPGSRTW